MLKVEEFKKWIEASHIFFEIFEGHYDVYPLAKKWAQEWLSFKEFSVNEKDGEIISHLISNFDYDAFRNFKDKNDEKWKDIVTKADRQFKTLVRDNLKFGKRENVGFAVAPFLFTWNFQRFKEYYKRREDFELGQYFRELGIFLENKRAELEFFKEKNVISEPIEAGKVKSIFEEVNAKLGELGIGSKEPIGTAKLLHVFAPYYFPLIDNKIAKAAGLLPYKGKSLTSESYINWMNIMKEWLQKYGEIVNELQNRFNSPILKLVDEGLYIMSTVKLQSRVRVVGLKVK